MKVSRKYYNLMRQGETGKLFILKPNNKYYFRSGPFYGRCVNAMYEMCKDSFIDYLEELFEEANIIDKKVILEIIRELKN